MVVWTRVMAVKLEASSPPKKKPLMYLKLLKTQQRSNSHTGPEREGFAKQTRRVPGHSK